MYIFLLRLPVPLLEFRYLSSECGREAFGSPLREALLRGRSFYWVRLQCLLWGTITKEQTIKTYLSNSCVMQRAVRIINQC